MKKTAKLLIGMILLALLVACKIEVPVPVGGYVTTQSGSFTCYAKQTCVIEANDLTFDETFIAIPNSGMKFVRWEKRNRGFFGGNSNDTVRLFTSGFVGNQNLLAILRSNEVFYLEPVFAKTASANEEPTLTISGARVSYWQDEAIDISFSVSNMDRATTNFSIANLNEGYDFTLESKAGTFRTISDQYTDAGEYSFTVNATDGNGKTASRSLQFRVDAVVIGASIFIRDDGPRGLLIGRSRDGLMWASASFPATATESTEAPFLVKVLSCFGESDVVGAKLSGSMNCGGQFPSSLDAGDFPLGFNAIARVEIAADINESAGSLVFIGDDGAVVGSWEQPLSAAQPFENFGGWPSNIELQGRFLPWVVAHQYLAAYTDPRLASEADVFLADFEDRPQLLIGSDYRITTIPPANSNSACVMTGQISHLSLSEYDLVYGDKGYLWQYVIRQLSGTFDATNCSNLGSDGRQKSIDQTSEKMVIDVQERLLPDGTPDLVLGFYGPGIERPFKFYARKICNADGSPTPVNAAIYQLPCG